jgi:hypothetical protein
LRNSHREIRDAAAEALGNIFGDKATQVLFEALQREDDRDVVWSILISLKPRISEHNLDQVLELFKRKTNVNLLYLVYHIAATVKPQLYGAELIRHIPNINNSEYIEEVESALRGLSDSELVELTSSLKDWANTLKKALLLLSFGRVRGDEVESQIYSILFPHHLEESGSGDGATPIVDWVARSLLQGRPSDLIPDWRKRFRTMLEGSLLTKPKTSPGSKSRKN